MQTTQKIGQFIYQELLNSPQGIEITDNTELLLDGLVDSLGVMRLATFIEQEFGGTVPPQDVTLENFRSLRTIDAYLKRRSI